MNPKDHTAPLPDIVQRFLKALEKSEYKGEILAGYADRLVNATDNSIYQILPQAVLAPRVQKDLNIVMKLAAEDDFQSIQFMPRGGGTGTNGQALNDCIILDTSKHLRRIIEINKSEGWVKLEPGVVLDQLNRELEKQNLWFPVHISTSKSCTLGGMVSTDACGKGSRVYGKTSDYSMSLTCILPNGKEIETKNYFNDDISDVLAQNHEEIQENVPDLPRGLSAYDLLGAYKNGQLSMTKLVAGSEGSLAVIKEIKLKVIEKPKHKALVAVFYDSFDIALRHAETLLAFDPVAIETIDDLILDLARSDILWHDVDTLLTTSINADTIKAIHFVEFEGDDDEALHQHCLRFEKALAEDKNVLGFKASFEAPVIKKISELRSKCVGLLGNMSGNRRPVPFMEDTAVPPANIADYIADLKSLLTEHNLQCGIFGHLDAGCLHVRPALDLRLEDDEKLVRVLSDEVVALVKKHGGGLWGEHGKGLRGEYTEELAGSTFYKVMQQIKHLLDPHNKLNPGKIAGPELKSIDDAPLRGEYDRQIAAKNQDAFPKATQCNGNGLCFSAMTDDTMCPSYKITKDRRHSPKGRAAMLREWMRLESTDKKAAKTFSKDVLEVMQGCLSCKACTSTCPIHVNIPDMKAAFLKRYYRWYTRPMRDYVIGLAEAYGRFGHMIPLVFRNFFGLVDLPKPSKKPLRKLLKESGFAKATPKNVQATQKPVLIVQDAYTSFFEPEIVLSVFELLHKLGYDPLLLPFHESGKSWHVRGFLKHFEHIVLYNIAHFENYANQNIPMIGIDPSITLVYRDEYQKILNKKPRYTIQLLQEFLKDAVQAEDLPKIKTIPQSKYPFFLHCTEKTMHPQSANDWHNILSAFGIFTDMINTGCCGMAGVYGHEKEHVENSKGLYGLSWKKHMKETALVTGYSCRSQVHRMEEFHVKHPVQLLNELL